MHPFEIKSVTAEAFKKYGKVLGDCDYEPFISYMSTIPIPQGITYVASSEDLESMEVARYFEEKVFGELPIQIGYCNGHNTLLNAAEYHKSSEVNLGVTDFLLILGNQADITQDFTYDTRLMEIFNVPAGIAVELFAGTLHYAPCDANEEGFKCIAILTKGTNTELVKKHIKSGEDQLMFAKNKWLIAHPESDLAMQGAFVGLVHENISVSSKK